MKSHIERFATSWSFDGYTEIVSIIVNISDAEYYHPTITELKTAIRLIKEQVTYSLFIDRPRSEFDCTGQYFTSDIELIDKEFYNGNLFYTYKHKVGRDV